MLYFVAIHKGMVTVPATRIKDVVAGRPIFRPSEAGTRDYVGPDDMAVKYVFVWPFFSLGERSDRSVARFSSVSESQQPITRPSSR